MLRSVKEAPELPSISKGAERHNIVPSESKGATTAEALKGPEVNHSDCALFPAATFCEGVQQPGK